MCSHYGRHLNHDGASLECWKHFDVRWLRRQKRFKFPVAFFFLTEGLGSSVLVFVSCCAISAYNRVPHSEGSLTSVHLTTSN